MDGRPFRRTPTFPGALFCYCFSQCANAGFLCTCSPNHRDLVPPIILPFAFSFLSYSQRVSDEENSQDVIVTKLYESTEEGQKVSRNKGDKFLAVFRRIEDPALTQTLS